jgi:translation elongation factor EF-1alpha
MFAGDLAIKKIVDKAIIVIGEGKVGKSTLFYHMLKFPMIGAMEKTKATKATKNTIYYELMFDKMKEKGISHSKTSESTTLIPNIERVTISAK